MRGLIALFTGCIASLALAQPPAKVPPAEPVPSLEAVLGKDTVAMKDIAYGKDEKQKLDVYSPKDAKAAPVVIYVHGGEWTKGDKADVSFKPKFFTENGIVFASVNYRLSPAAKHPAHVSDVAAALRFLTDHVAEYGGDPKKMVLMGHSAGCHVVTLTTLDPQYLEAVKLKPTDIRGVVAWSGGSFDLVHKAKVDEAFSEYIKNAFGKSEDAWKDASPVTHAKNAKTCPPYLFVTADPTGDSFKVASGLVKQINDAGGKATTLTLKDRTHKTANHLLGSPDDKTGDALLAFVRDVTKPREPRPDTTPILSKNTVAKRDVAFGKDEKQKLDVYSPKGAKAAPIVIYVHGGEWTKGDKTEISYKPKFFTDNGVVLISTNYRLFPDAKFPAHAEDVAAAVRWAVDHAAEVGGDPKKIILMGHSAGCHLVTLVGLDPKYLAGVKLAPSDLRGVVAWSGGAYDLVAKVAEGGSYKEHIGNAFGPDEAAWKDASPVTHAKNGGSAPPFLFAAYEKGNNAHKAADRLAGMIRDAKGKAEVVVLEDRTHQTASHLLGAPDDKTGAIFLAFLKEATK